MSEPSPDSAGVPRPVVSVGAVAVWLGLQLFAMLLGVWRVPLSANFPTPAERLALHEMLVIQIGSSALLYPILLRNWQTTSVTMLTALPFIQLSAFLSMTPAYPAMSAAGYVVAWLLALSIWRAAGAAWRRRLTIGGPGIALAAAWALGGAVAWYLHSEFATAAPAEGSGSCAGCFGPLVGAIAQVEQGSIQRGPWIALLLAIVIALVVRASAALVAGRAKPAVEESGTSR